MTQMEQGKLPTPDKLSLDPSDFLDAKIESFAEANLREEVLSSIEKVGWTAPTPVQALCLPFTVQGRDVAGFAQTGTGKTGVFLITISHRILKQKNEQPEKNSTNPKAIILAPTRELAMQISSDAESLLKGLDISFLAVFGGIDYEKQANKIKSGVDVIVATPGRLKDYVKKKLFDLSACDTFVCDEADRMFDMGFIEDVEFFLDKLGEKTQKLLFSATTNDQVKELAFEYLENPEYITVNPETITPENITQHSVIVESVNKVKVMIGLLRDTTPQCSIIFTNTKIVADWLHYKLVKNNFEADLITGDLPQKKRISLIRKIKNGEVKILIATDVASRGLHISGVTHVFNFDLPDEPANYVHRIGRTARAGAKGTSYSLVCEDYGQNLEGITNLLGQENIPKSLWYDSKFLEVEDISGNPYEDPEFKGTHNKQRDQKGQDRDRDRDRAGGRGRGGKPDRKSRTSATTGRGQQRGGKRPDRQDKRGASSSQRHDRPKKQRPRKHSDKQIAAKKPQEAPVPNTIGGMFKKIVRVIFGKK